MNGLPDDVGTPQEARERQSQVRHDLRAPLAVMEPLLSLLLESGEPLPPALAERLHVLERQVRRLEALIAGAADSGWFDCSGAPASPEALDLGELARELAAGRRLRGAGPALLVEAEKAAVPAFADRDRVRQIVEDLVRNVAQYAAAGGAVRVSVASGPAPATVRLVVADEGPGIPADELPHVVEFGYRGALARELGVPGLGIGLWVCRRLAESIGGGLDVASGPDAGTSVTLTLPAAR